MHASPDAALVRAWLSRAARRANTLAAVQGAAIGLLIAAMLMAFGALGSSRGITVGVSAFLLVAGALAGVIRGRRQSVPLALERAHPASRNLIVTADELIREMTKAPAYISSRVMAEATAVSRRVDLASAFPGRRTAFVLVAAVVVWSGALAMARRGPAGPSGPSSETAAAIAGVDVTVTPPEYSKRPAQTLRNPSRIEALSGSRIDIRVNADAASVTLETVGGTQPLRPSTGQSFDGSVLADNDGYLSLAPVASNGVIGIRRLIGLAVTIDRAPRIRITAPGHDLMVADGKRTIALAVEADDDFGLSAMRLRYTRVKGSGESFTFTDGDVALTIAKPTGRAWTARADWSLAGLDLEPGDLVIYRGVATDARPGAPAAESDAFIVEIAAPGALPGEGFAVDDRLDKYAISQQMVIVKTERLIAGRAKMTTEDFEREAQGIASEQRQVRAEFMFMMGGELADAGLDATSLNEEVEAEGEDDLAAGRLANQGRADLLRAIRSMSRAAARLADHAVTDALPHEKEALTYLQRAFARNRYILRMLAERERLDDTRRLTGTLDAIARNNRPAAEADAPPQAVALRRVLSEVAALAPAEMSGDACARILSTLAQRTLAIDPASAQLRDVAAALTSAAERPATLASPAARSAALHPAATALAAAIRAKLPADSRRNAQPQLDALAGALASALRQGDRR